MVFDAKKVYQILLKMLIRHEIERNTNYVRTVQSMSNRLRQNGRND